MILFEECISQVTAKVGAREARNCVRFPCVVLAVLIGFSGGIARADDDDSKGESSTPNVYLDMRTSYAKVPAGALAIGFGNSALQSAAISNAGSLPAIAGRATLPGAQSVVVDLPMSIDVTDDVSLYAGVSASSTGTPMIGRSPVAITSWNLGFQANLYNQNGGSIPTLSWQSTTTQAIPNGPFAATTFTNIFEFDYALDQEETRGWIAGMQDTRVIVGSPLATIHSDIMGYVGGYYQWPNNWKFTGRAGMQVFGGAQLSNLVSVSSFTQPILRLDLDRMDDNDNRLFGVTAQIMWVPKPAYQLTLRTPLYFVRN
ncbi:hypothetical protein RX327_35575 [Bradyrhizobium sp. BEA-2-5]|uniref:hypothetical protein n=1 Tax=Bradyrhizobium sp. BEA-2-5 TaxID=3080015 RepID=UPI00293F3566|nr:hypothetical protein [Bradyrhizobium sp. BEA-2-5]WOH80998.1 hypothetical protein RX327_35575 [Bradyrhizobium sp. BEA-2-5]